MTSGKGILQTVFMLLFNQIPHPKCKKCVREGVKCGDHTTANGRRISRQNSICSTGRKKIEEKITMQSKAKNQELVQKHNMPKKRLKQ